MSTPFQIAIDCASPHELVRFWAAAMELEIEDHDAQVRRAGRGEQRHRDGATTPQATAG